MNIILVTVLILKAIQTVGYWKLFEKAGVEPWKALVPFYSEYIITQLVGKPKWWIIYLFIPIIGEFAYYVLIFELLRCFGKDRLIHQGLVVFTGFIYLAVIGFDKKVSYLGTIAQLPFKQKTVVEEWTDAIVFAVVAATLIRWLIMEAYTIPTPSMENSLLVNDFLFVSKFHYGTRTPRTPLQIPLTHQKIWFTNIPSYLDWIQLPSYRLPGISHVKREDVVVFHVPRIEENNYEIMYDRANWVDYPVDLKTNYIKRCVGIPGDVLQIKDKQLMVNGAPLQNPEKLRFKYRVVSKEKINARNFESLGLDGDDYAGPSMDNDAKAHYDMYLTAEQLEKVKALPYIISAGFEEDGGEAPRFPFSKYTEKWTGDNYGPLTIPKEGMKIAINDSTLSIYGTTITGYDLNKDAKVENGKLLIDGKEVTEYTFKQDYFFMMGDNRDNSLDSRFWGFVPEDHIVGKGFFIWLSIDKYGSFFNKIRWKRFFKLID